MLYKNGKKFELDYEGNTIPEDIKQYNAWVSELTGNRKAGLKRPLIFKIKDSLITKYVTDQGIEKIEYPGGVYILLKATVPSGKGIPDEWIYTTKYITKDKQGNPVYDKGMQWDPSSPIIVDNENIDFGVFLNFMSTQIVAERNTSKRTYFELENKAKIAEEKIKAEQDNLKVKNAIYNELSEKDLRAIAKSNFIPGVDDMSVHEVQLALLNHVGTSKLSVKVFLEESKHSEKIEVKQLIQDGLTNKVLRLRTTPTKKSYFTFTNKENTIKDGDKIMDIKGIDLKDANNRLFEFLSVEKNSSYLEELKERLA